MSKIATAALACIAAFLALGAWHWMGQERTALRLELHESRTAALNAANAEGGLRQAVSGESNNWLGDFSRGYVAIQPIPFESIQPNDFVLFDSPIGFVLHRAQVRNADGTWQTAGDGNTGPDAWPLTRDTFLGVAHTKTIHGWRDE